jgi:hypothetical protein
MSLKTVGAAMVVALIAAGSAGAGVIDNREDRQQERIAEGVESGQLTARETARLERGEARIDRHVQRAESDGVVTPRERARLTRQQNRMSRQIYRQKHDGQTR